MRNLKMKKLLAAAALSILTMTACGSSTATASTSAIEAETPTEEAPSATSQDEQNKASAAAATASTETETTETASSETSKAETDSAETPEYLPEYVYQGDDPYAKAACDFTLDELAKGYTEGDALIPEILIIAEDDSDPEDIKVYGSFDIWTYDLNGETLERAAGGTNPGCIHMKKDDSGEITFTDFELVADGSDFDPTAKKIFGDHYENFSKAFSDDEAREAARKENIKEYVTVNNLSVKAYQDYGWDPVELF
ncbi:hypothetical protein QYZ88_016795 [Lachnospiraceae bacterium C1.1]|nr:hypothetical protein [Lachnospiraceae bacterium C1.1]